MHWRNFCWNLCTDQNQIVKLLLNLQEWSQKLNTGVSARSGTLSTCVESKGVQHSCQTRPCMGGDVGNLLGLDRVVSIELPAALAPGGPGLRASPTLTPRHRASQLRVKLTTQTQSTRTCVGSDNFDVTVNTRTLSPAFNASCKWPFKPTIRRPPTSAWGARDHHLPLSV